MRRIFLFLAALSSGCHTSPRIVVLDTTVVTFHPVASRTHMTLKMEK